MGLNTLNTEFTTYSFVLEGVKMQKYTCNMIFMIYPQYVYL